MQCANLAFLLRIPRDNSQNELKRADKIPALFFLLNIEVNVSNKKGFSKKSVRIRKNEFLRFLLEILCQFVHAFEKISKNIKNSFFRMRTDSLLKPFLLETYDLSLLQVPWCPVGAARLRARPKTRQYHQAGALPQLCHPVTTERL